MNITRQVFIGGCSRSGTTLLGSMIGGHSSMISTPESHFKRIVLNRVGDDLDAAYESITSHWRFKIWGVEPGTRPPEADSYAALLNWLVSHYADHTGKPSAVGWVDHTPENMSYGPTLLDLFPEAKLLHIVRDGRGVAASIMPLDWGPNTIERSARWWVESVSYGLALEITLSPESILRVHYEQLVTQPVQELERICAFLEIDYEPAMAEAAGFEVPAYTASQHELVGQKPDSSRATSWKRKLTPRQVEIFEYTTRDYLKALGYTMEYGFGAQGPSTTETATAALREIYRSGFSNRLRWLQRGSSIFLRNNQGDR